MVIGNAQKQNQQQLDCSYSLHYCYIVPTHFKSPVHLCQLTLLAQVSRLQKSLLNC